MPHSEEKFCAGSPTLSCRLMIEELDHHFIVSTLSPAWPLVFALWRRCLDQSRDFMAFKYQPKSAMPNLLLQLNSSANITLTTLSNFSPRETSCWAVIQRE